MIEAKNILDPADIDLQNHAVIEASAGTGKTYTIQNLVVRLLIEKGLDLSEILIVTFTEKATGELRERIFRAIEDAKADQPQHSVILEKALSRFSEAKIFTIHSFCQRVLQEFAFENGSSFNFTLTKDTPIYKKLLNARKREWQADEQVCSLLRENYQESKLDPILCELAAKSSEEDVFLPVGKESEYFNLKVKSLVQSLRAYRHKDFKAYATTKSIVKAAQKDDDTLQPILSILRHEDLDDLGAYEEILTLLPEKYFAGYLLKVTGGKNKILYDEDLAVQPDLVEFSNLVDRLFQLNQKVQDSPWLKFIKEEALLLKRAVKAYKQERSLLSFDDMINDVYKCLKGERGEIFKRSLQNSMKVGLIDEFQDTDTKQWLIFQSIFFSQQSEERLLYIIGDPKQAIYRFRGADINAYLKARHELLEGGANYYNLPVNWRSLPGLTENFNQLFSSKGWFKKEAQNDWQILFRNSLNQDSQDPDFRLKSGPAISRDESQSSLINVVEIDDADDLESWQLKKKMAEAYVENIHQLKGQVDYLIKGNRRSLSYRDMCILIRNRQDFAPLEKALKSSGIQYSFYKQAGIYQSSEAYALYYLLESFTDPGNSAYRKRAFATDLFETSALESVDKSSMAAAHPARVLWMSLLDYALKNRWSLFFKELISHSGLLIRLHYQGFSHKAYAYEQLADELLEQAVEMSLTVHSLSERLLQFIEEYEESESDLHDKELETDSVKIMTMHASKGLEFPVVFLFGGFSAIKERGRGFHSYFDTEIQRSVIDLTNSSEAEVLLEASEEVIRLFYVACTRAVLKLFVPCIEKKSILQSLFEAAKGIAGGPLQLDSIVDQEQTSDTADKTDFEYDFDVPKLSSFSQRKLGIYSFSSLAHFMDDAAEVSFSEKGVQQARYDDMEKAAYVEEGEDLILPRGAATGDLLHEILENMDYTSVKDLKAPEELLFEENECYGVISAGLQKFPLPEEYLRDEKGQVIDSHLLALARMIFHTLKSPIPELSGIPLCQLELCDTQREIEFNLPAPDGHSYLTGIIDLLMRIRKKDGSYLYYILDWKTTSVAGGYFKASLEESMLEKKYKLQYEMYSYAVEKWFRENFSEQHTLVGAVYIYMRGMNVNFPGRGVYYSKVDSNYSQLEGQISQMISKSSGGQ